MNPRGTSTPQVRKPGASEKTYDPPALTALGTVTELTLGGGGADIDGAFPAGSASL